MPYKKRCVSGRADPKKLARAIETELERPGSPEGAAGEKRYLKSDTDFPLQRGGKLAGRPWLSRSLALVRVDPDRRTRVSGVRFERDRE